MPEVCNTWKCFSSSLTKVCCEFHGELKARNELDAICMRRDFEDQVRQLRLLVSKLRNEPVKAVDQWQRFEDGLSEPMRKWGSGIRHFAALANLPWPVEHARKVLNTYPSVLGKRSLLEAGVSAEAETEEFRPEGLNIRPMRGLEKPAMEGNGCCRCGNRTTSSKTHESGEVARVWA
eukprot:SM000047S16826  [mRNA]  locus=s47:168165:168695:+ [translate_table: standard]